MWLDVPVFLYLLFTLLLLPYGYNCLVLVYGALKYRNPHADTLKEYPLVTIQLPVYNEKNVVENLFRSISGLDWPRDKLDIMVLDDSDDETSILIDRKVEELRREGLQVEAIRRKNRMGFKAGALQEALPRTRGKYLALFDADFTPSRSFLKDTIPFLEEREDLGFLQTRWGHINREQNRYTKAFGLALDTHHVIDQSGRYSLGLFMGFDGSAGVIRVSALKSVGGWMSDTLSEDLDLSIRLQLEDWKGLYLRDVVAYGLVPSTVSDFKTQQARWAKGSTQCARKHLANIWRSRSLSPFQKLQASIQVTNYSISLIMLLLVLTEIFMICYDFVAKQILEPVIYFQQVLLDPRLVALFTICTVSTYSYYYATIYIQRLDFRQETASMGVLALLGHGLSAACGWSILEGIFTKGGIFNRVPKYNIRDKLSNIKRRNYHRLLKHNRAEITLAFFSALCIILAYTMNILPSTYYLFVYLIGFFTVGSNL